MEQNQPTTKTVAYYISLVLAAIILALIVFGSPLFRSFEFWPKLGIFAGACIAGAIIYQLAVSIVVSLYKIIVELFMAAILLFNAIYACFAFASYQDFRRSLDLDLDQNWLAILILIGILFVVDLFLVVLIYPMARIANSDIENI